MTIPIVLIGSSKATNHPQWNECSINGRWFSFYPASADKGVRWFAKTPSADAWAQSGGFVDMSAEWEEFLRRLTALQHQHCFASNDDVSLIKAQIAERMTLPVDGGLLYRYSFGPGGYVDLVPGMDLQIERVLRSTKTDGKQGGATRSVAIMTTYQIVRNSDYGVQLKLARGGQKRLHVGSSSTEYSDDTLAARFKTSTHLRLMLESVVVSGNIKRPAILLGGSYIEPLRAATAQLESKPKASCTDIKVFQVTCVEFNGNTAVSPKFSVFVNHRLVYVPVGSKLWLVLPRMSFSSKSTLLKKLKVQRRFEKRYVDIRFDGKVGSAEQLTLFEGDKISW